MADPLAAWLTALGESPIHVDRFTWCNVKDAPLRIVWRLSNTPQLVVVMGLLQWLEGRHMTVGVSGPLVRDYVDNVVIATSTRWARFHDRTIMTKCPAEPGIIQLLVVDVIAMTAN